MHRLLREDSEGVASAVATILVLLIVLVIIQITVVGAIPRQRTDAEFATSQSAIASFERMRSMLLWPTTPGTAWSTGIPLGTPAVSPFASATVGTLSFGTNTTQVFASFNFVPQASHAGVITIPQDLLLVLDKSGSMAWNDPQNLRISGAQTYVGQMKQPDRVAIVTFDDNAFLVPSNVGQPADHLTAYGHDGNPDYTDPQRDLGTIGVGGGTNIGMGIQLANNELIANGNKQHAWVEIVLTDGQNNFAWQDTLTLAEAARAKANNITIYTIGLSSGADAALLSEVATITGGTYYNAPTASSIKWIYLEIAMHYQSAVQCGTILASGARTGSLTLTMYNQAYAPQTISMDGSGVSVQQPDGAVVRDDLGLAYSHAPNGAGVLTVPLLTLQGTPFNTTGTGVAFVNARVVSRYVVSQPMLNIDLSKEVRNIGNISGYVNYWTSQGAATAAAASAVNGPLYTAQNETRWAATNASGTDYVDARFNVEKSKAQLSNAITVAQAQASAGNMQSWMAQSIHDQATLESCRLTQWENWYDGVTVTVISAAAAAWAHWFASMMQTIGAPYTIGLSGNTAQVSIHALNNIVTDERVVELSFS
jgi:von Willebrand factor type A domain-containing protein